MSEFWHLAHPAGQIALVDAASGQRLTYGELNHKCAALRSELNPERRNKLGLVLGRNSLDSVAIYIAALQAHHSVALLDYKLDKNLIDHWVVHYKPDWIYSSDREHEFVGYSLTSHPGGVNLWSNPPVGFRAINSDLALLLSTSGSTGSSKMVRLSYKNLSSNARSITQYLGISKDERAITSLPMSYSYGLSVINSHLDAGACILLTDESIMQKRFWDLLRSGNVTSMAGVPFTCQTLLRMNLLEKYLPSLGALTQAGGRLEPKLIEQMSALVKSKRWRFFVMYGQTEATARISFVPPEALESKIGSIGIAIPGGNLRIEDKTSELIYEGPNVMMGYAENAADLNKGDELHGVLHTGDLANVDQDGYFTITGRLKRFIKIFGQRYSLDEVESLLFREMGVHAVCCGSDDKLCIALEDAGQLAQVERVLQDLLHLHASAHQVKEMQTIPRLNTGKVDYIALTNAFE